VSTSADRAHRRAQRQLASVVERRMRALVVGLDAPESQSAMTAYSRAAVPLVAGAQTRSATLSLAYMRQVATPRRTPSIERALRGVLVTAESPVATSPVLRIWGLVEQGMTVGEAQVAAASYAWGLASGDMAVAERGGLDEGATASGERIIGWRKELSPDSCDWCQLVGAERIYSSADSVPFHERDECSVAPVFESEGE
jgi:hypothetical protein